MLCRRLANEAPENCFYFFIIEYALSTLPSSAFSPRFSFYFFTTTTMTPVNSYALLDSSDVQYPQIKLLQSGSKEVTEGKCQAGTLLETLSGEISQKLPLIILGVRKEFRVWRDDDKLSKFPEYISNDMKTLRHLNPETGDKIGEEPLQQSEVWLDRKNKKKAKTQYFFLAVHTDSKTPVFFRVGGLGFKRARQFLNQARSTGKQLFEFITELSVASEPSDYGAKYVFDLKKTDQPLPTGWSPEQGAELCQKFMQAQASLSAPAANQ